MVDLPSPRYALRSASLAGVFYLVGGEDGHGLDDILVYNISANTFRLAGQLTTGRSADHWPVRARCGSSSLAGCGSVL